MKSKRAALSGRIAACAGFFYFVDRGFFECSERRIAARIIGLTHDHVRGFFRTALSRTDPDIVGISEPDAALRAKYTASHKLDAAKLFASHAEMLDKTRPEAVMVFTSTLAHRDAVALCASRKIHVMMEKPLAVDTDHTQAIAAAAKPRALSDGQL